MSNIGNFESIWRTLQYGQGVEAAFSDGTLLKSIESGLSIYEKPGGEPQAKQINDDSKLTSIEKSTALRFSALCSLSEKQSLELFKKHQTTITQQIKSNYLESDIENDGETSPAILSNLLKVYQKDRIYLIKITNFVLTAPEMATQREKLSSDFADKVLDQFQAKLKSDAVPPRSRDLNSDIIAAMHLQYLREKCFLVEMLLLALSGRHRLSESSIEKLFKVATKSYFLLNGGAGYLVDSVVADKLKNVTAVLLQLVLVRVVLLNLTKKDLIAKVDKGLLRLLVEDIDVLAPLQLVWAVVRSLSSFESGDENEVVIERLSTLAFSTDHNENHQSRVWSVAQRMIELPQLAESPETLTASAKVVLGLVDLVLRHFDIDSVGGATEVADTVATIFKIKDVAKDDFWPSYSVYAKEDQEGLAGFIERQIRLLPQEYSVTFKMISALTTDSIGAERVMSLLNELRYISEPITGRETADEIETNHDGSIWVLRRERLVSGVYTVEPGAKGEPMNSALGPVVQWNLTDQPADGWTILEGILTNPDVRPELTISALKLYTNMKSLNVPVYKDGFESLFKRLLIDYHHQVAGAFLDTMETLDLNLVKKILPGSGLFNEILSREKENATYPNTIKIVKLLVDLFSHHQTQLATVLSVLYEEIFGTHLSWQYQSPFEKVELSIALLQLTQAILKPSKLSGNMYNLFAENESLCRIVLTLSCLNSAEIDDTSSTSERFTTLLIEQVSAAFAILELILEKFQNDENSKMMRLLTQRTDNDSVCGFILKSVSGFIFHQSDSELPYVAIRLLGRLCHLGQVSLNATLGSYVFELRNALLGKMKENERLRRCVIELLSTIAEYQPSLLEIFVDLEDDKDKPGEKKIGPNSCLTVILDMLPKDASDELNLTMLESSFRFLHALWAGRRDSHKYFKVLRILRARPQFWSAVFLPFYLDMEVNEHKAVLTLAHSFAIVSHEYYFATKLHENFEVKLLQLVEHGSTLVDWSKFVSTAVERLCEMGDDLDPSLVEIGESLVSLVESWRCLWSILAPGAELKPNQKVACVTNGVSTCLTLLRRLSDEPGVEIRRLLLLMSSATLSNLAKCTFNQAQRSELLRLLHQALETIHADPGLVSDGSLLTDLLSMLSLVLSATSSATDSATQKTVGRILTRVSGFINTANGNVQILAATIIQQTFKILKTHDWLNVISDNNIFQAIITLLAQVATSRKNEKLGTALCSLLMKTSDNAQVMGHFIRLSLLSPLILASENLYAQVDEPSENAWPKLFTQLTLLQLQLLKCLGSLYISDALDWTGVHQRRFELILKLAGREGCSIELLQEANTILIFLIKVSDYRDMWIQTVGIGGSSAAECLQATARLLVSVPSRARLVGAVDAETETAEATVAQYRRILISSFQLLTKFSAPILQILLDEGIDAGTYQSILQPTLQEAQIGEMPTFGSCISCLNLGMHFLSSIPKDEPPSSKRRQETIFMIDQAIQLLLSQAAHLLLHTEDSRELTQFKHQLAAEIENNVNEARRQLKTNWPQSPSQSPRANRNSTSSLRRSKSINEGAVSGKDTAETGMLRIADQFKREMLS